MGEKESAAIDKCRSNENVSRRGQRHGQKTSAKDCRRPTAPGRASASVSRNHEASSTVLFLLFSCLAQACSFKIESTKEFSHHEVIEPRIFTSFNTSVDLRRLSFVIYILILLPSFFSCRASGLQSISCPNELLVEFDAFSKFFRVALSRNEHLLGPDYFEKHHAKDGTYLTSKPNNKNHCHYTGRINKWSDSWAALSSFNGSLSGVLSAANETFYVHFDDGKNKHLLFRASDLISEKKCGYENVGSDFQTQSEIIKRVKRSSGGTGEYYNSNERTRYVELVIVNDNKEYKDSKRNKETVIERSKQIANIVNALYNQLNVVVALVGVVVWTEYDEITLSADGDATLTNFLHYRRERLSPLHPNDNAQLITASSFDGGVVGKALKGPICTYEYSGGVNTDHSHIVGLVATTVAHELGHNFGMEHDTEKCKCPDDKCIMAPSSSSTSPRHWSSCSKEYLDDAFNHGMDHCLKNVPKKLFAPLCGNGFLDAGEECDCGLKEFCDNKCCNATTCKLTTGASCAMGQCCDKSTCSVISASAGKICRQASSECDLPETCDGKRESCPEDITLHDGTECRLKTGYCFSGKCNTHDSQCRLLWGPSGRVSDMKCFEQNLKGNVNGNCGGHRLNQSYVPCAHPDMFCGMLHCTHTNERLEYGMESAAILARSFIPIRGKILACRSAIIDLGSWDPGLVPNGAKCGNNKMCLDQKCVDVTAIIEKTPCTDNCNNNGHCDSNGNCHCFDEFAPPFCKFPLPQGFHLTVALYIIFLCILPLTAVAAFVAYYFHGHIKNWWAIKARKANIKSRAKQSVCRKHPRLASSLDIRTLEISEPIPLDEQGERRLSPPPPPLPFARTGRVSRDLRKSCNLDISGPLQVQYSSNGSCAAGGAHILQPTRPAPPPPMPMGTASQRSSTRSSYSSERGGVSRPSCPPPPRPVVPSRETDDRMLTFEGTRLAFVHQEPPAPQKPWPRSGAYGKATAPAVPGTSLASNRVDPGQAQLNSGNVARETVSHSSKVASLTKRFEQT